MIEYSIFETFGIALRDGIAGPTFGLLKVQANGIESFLWTISEQSYNNQSELFFVAKALTEKNGICL